MTDNPQQAQQVPQEPVEDIRYRRGRDEPGHVRNDILTVAVLLASATYQGAFNPPGGIWSAGGPDNVAGLSILTTNNWGLFYCFMVANTTAFLLLMGVIVDLTYGILERIALGTIVGTYCFRVHSITSNGFPSVHSITSNGFPSWMPISICGVAVAIVVAVRAARGKWWPHC